MKREEGKRETVDLGINLDTNEFPCRSVASVVGGFVEGVVGGDTGDAIGGSVDTIVAGYTTEVLL